MNTMYMETLHSALDSYAKALVYLTTQKNSDNMLYVNYLTKELEKLLSPDERIRRKISKENNEKILKEIQKMLNILFKQLLSLKVAINQYYLANNYSDKAFILSKIRGLAQSILPVLYKTKKLLRDVITDSFTQSYINYYTATIQPAISYNHNYTHNAVHAPSLKIR